jgi:hypothetical protein
VVPEEIGIWSRSEEMVTLLDVGVERKDIKIRNLGSEEKNKGKNEKNNNTNILYF